MARPARSCRRVRARGEAARPRGRDRCRSRRVPRARPPTARHRSPTRGSAARPRRRARAIPTRAVATHPRRAGAPRVRRRALPGRHRSRRPRTARLRAMWSLLMRATLLPGRNCVVGCGRPRALATLPPRAAQRVCRGGRAGRRSGRPGPERHDARGAGVPARARRRRTREGRHRRARERRLRRDARGRSSPSTSGSRRAGSSRRASAVRASSSTRMHAYRAIQAGDVDTVAIVYGNNQLSASGRTLGTGGGGRWRGGGMAMPLPMALRVPDRAHARRRVRDGRAAAHARVRHDARAARVDRGADARARGAATRTRCTAIRSRSTTCSASKLVADPLHKLDCCVISDGGCCIILTTEDRARTSRTAGLRARRGRRHDPPLDPGDGRHDAHGGGGQRPEGVRRSRASRAADVDMFAMYDSFTYTVLVVLEDLGFAPKGEGGAFVADNGATCASAARCRRTPTAADSRRRIPGMRGLVPAVRSDAAAARRGRRQPGRGRRDRGRARQRRLAVDAGHRRARNGGRVTGRAADWNAADWTETPK